MQQNCVVYQFINPIGTTMSQSAHTDCSQTEKNRNKCLSAQTGVLAALYLAQLCRPPCGDGH